MPKVICAECKAIEDIDEAPASLTAFLCARCEARAAQPTKPSEKHIPRKKHGTRVMLPITCARCGKSDTLDYVPKGGDLDAALCGACAQQAFGDRKDWAKVQEEKKKDLRLEHPFQCSQCGRTDYLPFEPRRDREYECNLCRFDHELPSPDRIKGRESAGSGGVFIRRTDRSTTPPTDPAED
jgi:CxxC-x17-CxxC domain-containing protein